VYLQLGGTLSNLQQNSFSIVLVAKPMTSLLYYLYLSFGVDRANLIANSAQRGHRNSCRVTVTPGFQRYVSVDP